MSALAIINLISALAPSAVVLIGDIKDLFAKHSTLTADQVATLVMLVAQQTQTTNADTLAQIAADQAKHPA